MRNTRSQAARRAASCAQFWDVIPFVALHVAEVRELVVLGACSKGCRYVVKHYVAGNLAPLLTKIIDESLDVDLEDSATRHQFIFNIQGLLAVVGNLVTSAGGCILMLPHVSNVVKRIMLQLGFRFTYDQLVSAARQRVAGVEHWVHLLLHPDPPLDLPQIALQVTRGSSSIAQAPEAISNDLNADNLGDILHLAVNCSHDQSVANSILEHLLKPATSEEHQALQDQMTPQLLQELLQTAVLRGHPQVVQQLSQFPAVHQLDAAAVRQLFFAAMQHYQQQCFMELLTRLAVPVVTRYLDTKTTVKLLVLAVRLRSTLAVHVLCGLGGAQHITAEQLEEFLQIVLSGAHLTYDTVTMLNALCSLSSAQHLSNSCISNCLTTLLLKAYSDKTIQALVFMCKLPPVQYLPAALLENLLSLAISQRSVGAAMMLVGNVLTVASLNVHAILRLVQQSFFLYDGSFRVPGTEVLIAALLKQPGALELTPAAAAELISYAIDLRAKFAIPVLCSKLTNLTTADILQLMTRAACRGAENDGLHVCYLLTSPAAQQFSEQQVQQVMQLVIYGVNQAQEDRDWKLVHFHVQTFCDMLAARPPGAGNQILGYIHVAIEERCGPLARALLAIPAAEALSAADVQAFLMQAIQQGLKDVAEHLVRRAAANSLQPQVLPQTLVPGISSVAQSSSMSQAPQNLPSLLQQQQGAAAVMAEAPQQPHQTAIHSNPLAAHHQLQHGGAVAVPVGAALFGLLEALFAAIQRRCLPVVGTLLSLPEAAVMFNSNRTEQLLNHAVDQHFVEVLPLLGDLPAAATIPASLVERMLCCAMQHDPLDTFKQLCESSLVDRLEPHAAARLLRQAQANTCYPAISLLLHNIPAVQRLGTDVLVSLIKVDLQLLDMNVTDETVVEDYMKLPAVQHLTAEQITDLLRTAVRHLTVRKLTLPHWSLVETLCCHTAAQHIGATAAEALLQTCMCCAACSGLKLNAAKRQFERTLLALLQLPGVQQLTAAAKRRLLHAAIVQGQPNAVGRLVHLPAAAELTAADMQQLLHVVVCTGSNEVMLLCLGKIPACWAIAAGAVVELFDLAMMQVRSLSLQQPQAVVRMQHMLLWLLAHPAMQQQVAPIVLRRLLSDVKGHKELADVKHAISTILAAR